MQDTEIQRELLRETVEPAQALRLAISMEPVQRNQFQFLSNQPSLHVNAITPQRPFRNPNQRENLPASIRQTNQLCQNCGLTWSASHKDKCIAKCKTCKNSVLQNHFSRVCSKPKFASSESSQPNLNSTERRYN